MLNINDLPIVIGDVEKFLSGQPILIQVDPFVQELPASLGKVQVSLATNGVQIQKV